MDAIIQSFIETYSMFFDWEAWGRVLSDPVSWGYIGTLIILEGLLSADNALVLAVMVKHLPPEKRKKALFYGLLGAYIFRFIAIGVGVLLIKLWWVKVLGAAYLAYLAIKYFIDKRKEKEAAENEEESHGINQNGLLIRLFGTFWGTVVAVELMDIAFSVDSVLAAFGVSNEVWVLLVGGMLGVLMMRGVAGVFLKLIDRVPELESTAYILILIISVKMFLGVFGVHVHHIVFFGILIIAFAATFVVHNRNKKKAEQGEA
ncbi:MULTISPECIES: TerC family protein [Bacillaceae]|uniref:TerC family protein n=1 Tax=Bacillaceae TaxID=186817 RepID=UPI001E2F32DD|nr:MULTISPECIES: TerC family protein [Bacillaceae]MCE4047300.1 TerC family protein [Bacillus sp. Au-Bac7]MCM3030579.1 TerC family protein [Niallia sp. MER 6]MDL0437099.1 TerC family protein [Niallia sp. SS-2023]UPO86339.1 TerC family protein [Niallia sp. Man26]